MVRIFEYKGAILVLLALMLAIDGRMLCQRAVDSSLGDTPPAQSRRDGAAWEFASTDNRPDLGGAPAEAERGRAPVGGHISLTLSRPPAARRLYEGRGRGGPFAIDQLFPFGWGRIELDLNRASPALLAGLRGIGPRTAERIVQTRRRLGRFRSLTDLERVRGIGPKRVARLATLLGEDRP